MSQLIKRDDITALESHEEIRESFHNMNNQDLTHFTNTDFLKRILKTKEDSKLLKSLQTLVISKRPSERS